MKNKNRKYALAFSNLINFNFFLYEKLIRNYGDLEKAFYSSREALLSFGLKADTVSFFIQKRDNFSWEKLFFNLEKEKIKFCFIEDDNYPKYLKKIYSPPPIFYYQGNLDLDWDKSLSVVGARKFSEYGEEIVNNFIPVLSSAGLIIISGLALGIDSLAHRRTLDFKGKTVAVLGSGLDRGSIYPYINRYLVLEIISRGGLIISEFPIGSKPLSYHFPQRNRIIAGLSPATLVVEAGLKSGSLITARNAMEEGREVLSFPADIFKENLAGNNKLLQDGAGLVSSVSDILAYFNISWENAKDVYKNSLEARYEP